MSKTSRKKQKSLKTTNEKTNQLISSAPKSLSDYYDLADELSDSIDSNGSNLNIGVIGSFGTGKSSFLKTFKERIKKHKIVTVSLATFQNQNEFKSDDGQENGNYKAQIEKEKYLESIIIQQILYSAKRYQLPDSRIKRIGIRVRSILLIIFLITALLLLMLYSKLQFAQQLLWIKDI